MTALSVRDPEARAMLALHVLGDATIVHTNLDRLLCACRSVVARRPQQTGNTCSSCGGMAVQTGSCTTCVECGTSGGCA